MPLKGWICALLGVVATASAGHTAPKKTAADALAALDTTLGPIAKLAPGADRTQRACSSIDALQAGADGVPHDPPPGNPLDASSWGDARDEVAVTVKDLGKACKASDKQIVDSLKKVHTADQLVIDLDVAFRGLVDAAKPRTLPASLKAFDAKLRPFWADKHHKHACDVSKKLLPLAKAITTPSGAPTGAPAGVDAGKWDPIARDLAGVADEMVKLCDQPSDFSSDLEKAHDDFYKLVRMVPADTK
jgi:hypothetical protein